MDIFVSPIRLTWFCRQPQDQTYVAPPRNSSQDLTSFRVALNIKVDQ